MPQITVTPKYVNDPRPGKKMSSINCDGTYYGFDAAKIPKSAFAKGVPVTIEYSTSQSGYHTITRIISSSGGAGGSHERNDRIITLTAIAKSCIEAGKDTQEADQWIEWIDNNMQAKKAASAEEDPDDAIPF